MEQKAELEGRFVGNIAGKFVVKSYQRGYRWGKSQVLALLNDIYDNGANPYCLQPIVVRETETPNEYELIDGQQRLTTLLIILKYIKKYVPFIEIKYSISYETRTKTAEFLEDINEEGANDNIDFYHIYHAYEEIDNWFKTRFYQDNNAISNAAFKLFNYLNDKVKVIWYEVGPSEDPISLFARLNIGKIALTNAELVKALFILKANSAQEERFSQKELSFQWDNMEHEMRENGDEFWGFMTRRDPSLYPTRVELLFDFMSGKTENEREQFFTFFYFEQKIKEEGIGKVWLQIQHDFLQLREWFSDIVYYHKIGYLIASGSKQMPEILKLAMGKRKNGFVAEIDKEIAESIKSDKDYGELSYRGDYDLISKILLLFNVQSMLVSESRARFPFMAFNNADWSLEHIHAQQSQGLRTDEKRLSWLKNHIDYIRKSTKDFDKETLVGKMDAIINSGNVSQAEFDQIAADAFVILSEDADSSYVDLIGNMALLSKGINSCLNNSVFAVKRDAIIELDRKGAFIPYCTKMVFLKYYTSSSDTQFEFWGASDRDAYLRIMGETLQPYLNIIKKSF